MNLIIIGIHRVFKCIVTHMERVRRERGYSGNAFLWLGVLAASDRTRSDRNRRTHSDANSRTRSDGNGGARQPDLSGTDWNGEETLQNGRERTANGWERNANAIWAIFCNPFLGLNCNIFVLKNLIDFRLSEKQKLYTAFLDYRRAFDTVDRSYMLYNSTKLVQVFNFYSL